MFRFELLKRACLATVSLNSRRDKYAPLCVCVCVCFFAITNVNDERVWERSTQRDCFNTRVKKMTWKTVESRRIFDIVLQRYQQRNDDHRVINCQSKVEERFFALFLCEQMLKRVRVHVYGPRVKVNTWQTLRRRSDRPETGVWLLWQRGPVGRSWDSERSQGARVK